MLARAGLFLLLSLPLLASDFTACQKVLTKSFKMVDGHHAVYTSKGWLLFSETPISSTLIKKQNMPLGLYLLEGDKAKEKIKIYNRFPKDIALITPYSIRPNTIVSESVGIDTLAQLKDEIAAPFAVMGACCTLRGFNGSHGVITSDFINMFLERKERFLASAGVRFEEKKEGVFVSSRNPFFEYNPFQVGDKILFFDKKKVTLNSLEKALLFSKVGSTHYFLVERQGKKESLSVSFKKRLGGGVLGDTFLEHLGFRFNDQLSLVYVAKNSVADHLKLLPDDRLIAVNGVTFSHDKAVRDYFSKQGFPKEKLRLLIEREGLQFFVYVPVSSMKKSQ